MKRLAFLTAAIMVLALGSVLVIANHDAQSATGQTGAYSAPATNQVATQGGNVTENNVSSIASTGNWQGFYGNITGSLRLGDGSAIFYDWSGVPFQAVYASPSNAITWGGLVAMDSALELEGKDANYSFTATDDDSINSTFTGNTCAAGTEIAAAAGVYSYNSTQGNSAWETCIADDGGNTITDTVFGTNIQADDSYAGTTVDYQLMVPVNATGQLYYFYLEA